MMYANRVGTRCHCGAQVMLQHMAGNIWARCPRCFDAAAAPPARASVQGIGTSEGNALFSWCRAHAAAEAAISERSPPSHFLDELGAQIAIEAMRQRGWSLRCAGSGLTAAMCPPGGELAYGPSEQELRHEA